MPYDGYEFVGWYEGANLISIEPEYRFRVSEDIVLIAAFKPSAQNSGIRGDFKVVSQWDNGFNGEVTLTNVTDDVIHDWIVAFDLPYEITKLWEGEMIAYDHGVYTVKNAKHNIDIKPGESVTFGFIANADTEIITEPSYYSMVKNPENEVTQNFEITYKVNSNWETAFNGQIEIKNISSEDVLNWTLEFDCNIGIKEFWDADIVSHVGNHYVIKNKGYNAAIKAGETLILEFESDSENVDINETPANYKLVSVDMD